MALRKAFEFMTMMPEDIRDKCKDLLNDIDYDKSKEKDARVLGLVEGRSDSSTTIPTKRKAGKGSWRKTETAGGDKIRRRGTGDNTGGVGSSRNGRNASEQVYNNASQEALSADERRVIGEYFPEFNKSEDVRHRTQVANTKSTYEKIGHYLEDAGIQKS